jgi:hypothetical protein
MTGIIQKMINFLEQIALYASSLFLVWIFLVAISYGVIRWCIKQEMSIVRIVSWISGGVLALFFAFIIFHLFAYTLQIMLTTIVIKNTMCAFVLHLWFLAIDRFLKYRYGNGMIQTRLVTLIIAIYCFFLVLSLVLLHNQSTFLLKLFTLTVEYLTQIGLVTVLIFEIVTGRSSHIMQQELDNNSHDGSWL